MDSLLRPCADWLPVRRFSLVTIQPAVRNRAWTYEVALRRLPSVRAGGPGGLRARLPFARL